ncbi:glycosyltransferase family 8 protein [Streptococcus pluranimalium]|uniref:General stress protein A n=1 Tax=Streptococcus pluranimalium TaxID=82348 RepID=A0A345VMS1_9STRE|nr:glycosyltransferase family 8 protein [Streptococcus pluranimalium]AXJ14023.1 General stress protein A [Streptococcus pluranimalium]
MSKKRNIIKNKKHHKNKPQNAFIRKKSFNTVVLAGDYGYVRQIETLLKSLVYHNRYLKIYVFNKDIPKEWFQYHKRQLQILDCELVDVKLLNIPLNENWYSGYPHINFMAFARYFIPQFVSEEKVLYLDSDMIVTGNLDTLFKIDLSNHALAAVEDRFNSYGGFNSGVLLINNKSWKDEKIQEKLVSYTAEHYQEIKEGDQTVLNHFFGKTYLKLNEDYNFLVGQDHYAFLTRDKSFFEKDLTLPPTVVHYLTHDKPWNTHSSSRLRELWWQYHWLTWEKIITERGSKLSLPNLPVITPKGNLVVVTNTHLLEKVESLIQALPDYDIHIAAFTDMAPSLKRLEGYDNVYLHVKAIGYLLIDILETCDAYLDINHGTKLTEMIDVITRQQKPIFTFNNVVANELQQYPNLYRFEAQDAQMMADKIREVL